MKRFLRAIVWGAAAVVIATPALAQGGIGVRSVGVAGAYMGLARGYDALYWNPANLGIADRRPVMSIGLPQVQLTATSQGPTFSAVPTSRDVSL